MDASVVNSNSVAALAAIEKHGLVPVLVLNNVKDAVPLAEAVAAGGVKLCEVSFRSDCAAEAIAQIAAKHPDIMLGAGAVSSVDRAVQAIDAGAKFVSCPGLADDVVAYCQQRGVLVIPGCTTATEVQRAVSQGLTTLRFFPAEASGGLDAVSALSAAFNEVRFVVSGGIDAGNLNAYANHPAVLACAGCWMIDAALVRAGKFDEVKKGVRNAVFKLLNFRFAHFGINCETSDEGYTNIFKLADMFDLTLGDTESSTYVGKEVEITKQPFKVRGPHGHIGYHTDNLAKSMFYLGNSGVEFNMNSIKNYADKPYVVYLKDHLAGFAIHIEERNDHNPPSWDHRDDIRKKINWPN